MNSPDKSKALKLEILRRHREGENCNQLAKALGITRQYAHYIVKQVAAKGEARTLKVGKRGRTKAVPISDAGRKALLAYIVAGLLPDGSAPPGFTEKAVAAWFKKAHGQRPTVHQIRILCTQENLKLYFEED